MGRVSRAIGVESLARPLGEVARGLVEWQRGDPADAAVRTLAESARDLHRRAYTLWIWEVVADGTPCWLLPVATTDARAFSPPGPARALARTLAAAIQAGADREGIVLQAWSDLAFARLPGLDPEIAPLALEEHHPDGRVDLERLPGPPPAAETVIDLDPAAASSVAERGLAALAAEAGVHPLAAALTLAEHGQPVDLDLYPPGYARRLHDWGLAAPAPKEEPPTPDLGIDADPCPRRRGARRLLRRLYGMKKIGEGHHTEFDHVYRGVPADGRDEAAETARALIRAGLLGEKPSVGQRHVYLRREALPEIHALMERGETADPNLAALWTCPPPGELSST